MIKSKQSLSVNNSNCSNVPPHCMKLYLSVFKSSLLPDLPLFTFPHLLQLD